MKDALVRNERWLTVVLSTLVAIVFSIYVGFFSSLPGNSGPGQTASFAAKLGKLGALNGFALAGVVFLLAQVLLTLGSNARERHDEQSEGTRISEALLDSVVRLLGTRRKQTLRALVTIADDDMKMRNTVCGANIRVDPEVGVPVPLAFGIAGEAFMTRSVQYGDIDDLIRGKDEDGTVVPGIWSEIRSVLAFPMLAADGSPFGTVNFDSDKPASTAGFSDRNVQDALARVAQIVTYLMRSHSPDGKARLPG